MQATLPSSHAAQAVSNADAIADFALDMRSRALPDEIRQAARFCVVDWFGVAIGAHELAPARAIRRVVESWGATGNAQLLLGGKTTPIAAALVNGTMAHCLDFDDTHVGSIAHLSGPTWAATFAVGTHIGATPEQMLNAFVAGFEVGGRLGGGGFGVGANERHIHATGVFGCLSAAVAAANMYGLDTLGVKRAVGLAATQVGGLTGSFGTPAKPFHAGKAGMNGVLSAQMAGEGFNAALDLVEPGGGLDRALVQDKAFRIQILDFAEGWEIVRNTFKPYASCLLTHPVIDAAKVLRAKLEGRTITKIRVLVHPLSIQLAGKSAPTTPFEGKFSLAFCTALAISGQTATQDDFNDAAMGNPALQALIRNVELVPVPAMALTAADLELVLENGETLRAHTPLALGNPGRPMSWHDMEGKFLSLTTPVLGGRAQALFGRLKEFDREPDLAAILKLIRPTGN